MSGYRKVNYYELCRLCTSSEGSKMNIFGDEGRRRQLQTKIQTYLLIKVLEDDLLPKIVCHKCVKKLESFIEFQETVVKAEGMLKSYFTSLRFSEEFVKEGKVYVKNTEKSSTPEDEILKSMDKGPTSMRGQIMNNQQLATDQIQHQQPIIVNSNINTSNIQIISGVQARVQQYKCAMQMQSGGMAATVVEATTETHYSYQQQTSQVSSQQSNEVQNQISDQQNQSSAIQQPTQNQIQNHSQMNQQVQSQRAISQQLSQTAQLSQQQQQNQNQVSQQQQVQGQSQISQQLQQLQRQQCEFEKQQAQIITQQEFLMVQQNNNIVLKTEDIEPKQQIMQKIQSEAQKDESSNPNVQTCTAVQITPEVFLNLGFKESPLMTVRDDKDFKEFAKMSSEDGMSRNSIEQIREFLGLRSGSEPDSLITVYSQGLSQIARNTVCRDCGKSFPSFNQMSSHNCNMETLVSKPSDRGTKQSSVKSFSCDICSKSFKRKKYLFQHRKLHTGLRPYVCTTCTKAFSRKQHLVKHSVSHTGQKMHECELRGNSFVP